MNIIFRPEALKQFEWWHKNNKKIAKKIASLIQDIEKNPSTGIGKPEALKHNLAGLWSRRIDREHRLIYKIGDNEILVISCKFHYD